jgi:hypothetical protein
MALATSPFAVPMNDDVARGHSPVVTVADADRGNVSRPSFAIRSIPMFHRAFDLAFQYQRYGLGKGNRSDVVSGHKPLRSRVTETPCRQETACQQHDRGGISPGDESGQRMPACDAQPKYRSQPQEGVDQDSRRKDQQPQRDRLAKDVLARWTRGKILRFQNDLARFSGGPTLKKKLPEIHG